MEIDEWNPGQALPRADRLVGVIGWPVAHSLSPRLHGFWLRQYGIDGAYVRLPVRPENLADVMAGLPDKGFIGWNVTVPHKEAALAGVTEVDPAAARIGAVNTVSVRRDGTTVGSNSDGFGFLENLRDGAPGWDPSAGPAVLVGAGGAAKAVAWALADAGAPHLRILNRTAARALELATAIGPAATVVPWEDRTRALEGAALVVNATSLGMTGQPQLDLSLESLPNNAVVNDLVYVPEVTALLDAALARGNPTVGGIGMLLHQGRSGFAVWFGVEPEVTQELRDFVCAGLNESA